MRSWISWFSMAASLSLTACGAVQPSPYDASSWREGWGSPHAPPAGEIYPAKFPRVADEDLRRRETELRAAPWTLGLEPSGFLAQAALNVDDGDEVSSTDLEQAQSFIDNHLALFGLARRAPLKKWDDGLYYVSPVDDPRFGISVEHRQTRLTIVGHVWPGFTFQSSARRTPSVLLGPWLGMRVGSADPIDNMPCDPAGPESTCPQAKEPQIVVVGPDIAHYVVSANANEASNEIEVREVLVLDLPHNPTSLDAGKTLPPFALDARTGEAVSIHGVGAGMCGPNCVAWGSARTEHNFIFWHWVSLERLQRDVMLFAQ